MSDLDLTNPYDPDAYQPRPRSLGTPPPAPPARPADPPPPAPVVEPVESASEGTVAWKAAASSVPRLRQQPVAEAPPPEDDAFPGFAQDAIPARDAGTGPDADPGARPSPRPVPPKRPDGGTSF